MRIGVDATCWANARGYGRFTRELVAAMVAEAPQDEFVCFLDEAARATFALQAPNVTTVVVPQGVSPTTAAGADSARAPLDMLRLTRAVAAAKVDVFFSPSVYTYFPLPPGLRAVVTVHDAIAERFPELTLPSPRARLFWRAKVWLALRQARLVLTVSDYSARDIAKVLGVARHRLRVALEAPAAEYAPSEQAADIARVAAASGIPAGARWIVYVGGFNPHKRVEDLVRAHAALAKGRADAPLLVLVGTTGGDVFHGAQASIHQALAESGTAALVRWTGFLADADLRHLLSGAIALALPSMAEGFGLPAIEAAACGTPVVATSESPLPDLLAGGGFFVAPGDVASLQDALRHLTDNEPLRRSLGAVAKTRADALTWPAGARAALSALREAAA
jgi:glycosyltransferase involved in cell wall biosynthesis